MEAVAVAVKERGFRPRQKGVPCSIDGCDDWCVSNDLCPKHNMRERRKQEKYKAYTREYNKKYKRPDIDKVCELCGAKFVTARESQTLCSECSGSGKANYLIQKRYRSDPDNAIKIRARGIVSKRIQRGVSMFKETCVFCGEDAEAHHEDYSKPLDVTWVCKKHHGVLGSFSWNKE